MIKKNGELNFFTLAIVGGTGLEPVTSKDTCFQDRRVYQFRQPRQS